LLLLNASILSHILNFIIRFLPTSAGIGHLQPFYERPFMDNLGRVQA